jgi:Ca2+-binding RTX toxin-like protein
VEDFIDGGAGRDVASYAGGAAVTVALDGSVANGGDAAGDTLSGIEDLEGSSRADWLVGNTGGNQLIGGGGADTMTGGEGNDTIFGGDPGDRVIFGGAASSYAITQGLNDAEGV